MLLKIQRSSSFPRMLDLAERFVLVVLFGSMVFNFVSDWLAGGDISSILLVVSEATVLIFVLFRRFTEDVSMRVGDWVIAFAATTAPLLARPVTGAAIAPIGVIAVLMLTGLVIQFAAKLTLRRSFGVVAANRGVKVGGPYRFVRHPMYAGYLLTHIGFLLSSPSLWNFSIYAICLACQIDRIMAEERLLSGDSKYTAFIAKVRYRLVPGVF